MGEIKFPFKGNFIVITRLTRVSLSPGPKGPSQAIESPTVKVEERKDMTRQLLPYGYRSCHGDSCRIATDNLKEAMLDAIL